MTEMKLGVSAYISAMFSFKGVLHPWTLFLKTVYFPPKIKQLWTMYPMDQDAVPP